MKLKPIKVSMLTQYIKKFLKSNSIFYNISVEGEISNIRISKSGYTYFTLSDNSSSISCVCFYEENNCINGDSVVVTGELTIYEYNGNCQIIVNNVEKKGIGNILKELELLKKTLEAKGLFNKNKPIVPLPSKIGIITAKTGAAIQDILKTFNSVNGSFEVLIYDSLVQGNFAKKSIIEGIEYFNTIEKPDVIILARGGGSFEDLKIFNDADIAEKIYVSEVPIVTGIGHDTDVSLCDYVADVHCHTPTAAAEYVIRGYKNAKLLLENLNIELRNHMRDYLRNLDSELFAYQYALKAIEPSNVLEKLGDELDNYAKNLDAHVKEYFIRLETTIKIMNEKLNNLDYKKQLEKGYALVFDENKNLLDDYDKIREGSLIKILLNKSEITAEIKSFKRAE